MSEPISITGNCGQPLKGKLWKQGGSIKCSITGDSIVSYPRPSKLKIIENVIEICEGCGIMSEKDMLRKALERKLGKPKPGPL